jgi:hypothetical protein
MPFYLQRVRFTVHTKKQLFAGTNSTVKLCYRIEEKHVHPKLETGIHSTVLDHPWHDDFQSGKSDSYEVDFGTGKLGKSSMGRPMLNGVQFETMDDARQMKFHLRIEGSDQWVFDRYALAGYFMEVRPVPGTTDVFDEIDLGWLEMARKQCDVEMSSDPNEGSEEYPLELNGPFLG